MAKSWKNAIIELPAVDAAEAAPDVVEAGGTTLYVLSERSAESAFWGQDARRHAVEWEHGATLGKGYIEFRPLSSTTSEVVLHLRAPKGVRGRLAWPSGRLGTEAERLIDKLRAEIQPTRARAGTARRARRSA